MQKAIGINYSKMDGSIPLQELQDLLQAGWTVNTTAVSGGGVILVILDEPKPPAPATDS